MQDFESIYKKQKNEVIRLFVKCHIFGAPKKYCTLIKTHPENSLKKGKIVKWKKVSFSLVRIFYVGCIIFFLLNSRNMLTNKICGDIGSNGSS